MPRSGGDSGFDGRGAAAIQQAEIAGEVETIGEETQRRPTDDGVGIAQNGIAGCTFVRETEQDGQIAIGRGKAGLTGTGQEDAPNGQKKQETFHK